MPATAHWPIVVARNWCICSGLARHTIRAMKYVSTNTASVETSDWAELERIRRAISMRSRIVRPTLARVGARLPPVSAWTERAEAKSRKVSSGNSLRQSVVDGLRVVAKADAAYDLFQLRAQGAARFDHGVLQRIGHAGPGLQGGHHQVDGLGQLGFDLRRPPHCQKASSRPPSRPTISEMAITKGRAQPRTKCKTPAVRNRPSTARSGAGRGRSGPRARPPFGGFSLASCSNRCGPIADPRVPPVPGGEPELRSGRPVVGIQSWAI